MEYTKGDSFRVVVVLKKNLRKINNDSSHQPDSSREEGGNRVRTGRERGAGGVDIEDGGG